MSPSLSRRALLVSGLTAVGGTLAARTSTAADSEEGPPKGQLTIESLGTLLSALGLKATKTESRYDFQFTARHGEEWTLSMSVVLSTDEKTIWIMAWLDELPKSAADVPRTSLLRLLADNDKMGNGHFFAYVSSNRRFVLQRVLKNEYVTSASFKNDLLQLGAMVVEQYPHWSVANWKLPGTAAGRSGAAQDDDGDVDDGRKSNGSRPGAPPASRAAAKGSAAPRTLTK